MSTASFSTLSNATAVYHDLAGNKVLLLSNNKAIAIVMVKPSPNLSWNQDALNTLVPGNGWISDDNAFVVCDVDDGSMGSIHAAVSKLTKSSDMEASFFQTIMCGVSSWFSFGASSSNSLASELELLVSSLVMEDEDGKSTADGSSSMWSDAMTNLGAIFAPSQSMVDNDQSRLSKWIKPTVISTIATATATTTAADSSPSASVVAVLNEVALNGDEKSDDDDSDWLLRQSVDAVHINDTDDDDDEMRVFFADIVKNNNNIFNNVDEGYSFFGFNHFAPTIAGSAIETQQIQEDDDAAWMAIVNKANNNNNNVIVDNNNNNDNDEDWIIAFPTKVVAKDRRQESCDDEAIKAAVAEMLEKLSSSSSSSSSLAAFAVSA